MSLRDFLFGRPLATEESEGERVGAFRGLPILGLDALASASYGPEALLTVLLPLSVAGLRYVTPLTLLIVALLGIVFVSYRQTIDAYPGGGGAYTVAKENLGTQPALVAAAALALDYLLNVAVAISAGVGACVSAIPALLPHTLPLCLLVLAFMTLVNLRGVRATGAAFALPTYAFVVCLGLTIAAGVFKAATHGLHPIPVVPPARVSETASVASLWLVLRAFSNGCTAMTGVEAVSNGVPIFQEPSTKVARRTLTLIIAILAALLLGIAFLCRVYEVTATPPGSARYQSIVSQVVAAAFGRGAFYYVTLGSVFAVLALSANTSFADFPRLCRILAEDKFLPEPFVHRGRRLSFSYGILTLSVLSGILLVVFQGVTDRLIPLFAVGAFLAFTMSQAGMVAHWKKRSGRQARTALVQNAAGALATGTTLVVVLVSKFTEGAWITVLLILVMMLVLRQVHRHYQFLAHATATAASLEVGPPKSPVAIVPLRRWDAVSLKALQFSIGFAEHVFGVQVLTEDRRVDDLSERWPELVEEPARRMRIQPPELVVLRSEYRRLFSPLLDWVLELTRRFPDRQIALVVPELVETRWYHYLLHNHTASVLKALLLFRGGPQIVIISIPWYLEEWMPEQRLLRRRAKRRMARVSPPSQST